MYREYNKKKENQAESINSKLITNVVKEIEKRTSHNGNYHTVYKGTRADENATSNKCFLQDIEKFMNNIKFYIEIYKKKQDKYITGLESSKVNFLELLHHIRFSQLKAESFTSRDTLLQTSTNHVQSEKQYLVFNGVSGCGKTSAICKICKDYIYNICKDKSNTILLMRYIGTSEDSHNIQTILKSIIFQLEELVNKVLGKNTQIPKKIIVDDNDLTPIHNLYKYFSKFFKKIGHEFKNLKFVLILDSLDQLSDDHNSRSLEWIPMNLPKNFKIILSTIKAELGENESDGRFGPYSALRDMISETNFIPISDLSNEEIEQVYCKKFGDARRILQESQKNYLLEKLKNCRSPLYLKIVIDQALKWDSEFDSFDESAVGNTVDDTIEKIFEEVEKTFRQEFVGRILKFISINKYGLDINNLIEVLASDQKLVYYIEQYFGYGLQNSQVSQLFIMQVLYSLRDYMSRPRYNWYHRKFIQIANIRYCHVVNDKADNINCFNIITNCYAQYKFSDVFWIRVLPYLALNSSDDSSTLRNDFLLNIEFMQKKIEKCYVDELINDYQTFINFKKKTTNWSDKLIDILNYTLINASSSIRTSSYQLPGHLLGYLLDYRDEFEDDKFMQELNDFNNKCKELFFPVIIPNKRFLTECINKYPIVKICGMSEIKSIQIHEDHIFMSTDSFIVRDMCENRLNENYQQKKSQNTSELLVSVDNKYQKKILRKSQNTSKLMVSVDCKSPKLFAWSDHAVENDKILIEVYDLKENRLLPNGYRPFTIQASTQVQLLQGFNTLETGEKIPYLWLITNNSWHNIDVDTMEEIPWQRRIPWNEDNQETFCCASNENTLFFAFNNSSKINILSEEKSSIVELKNKDLVTGTKFLFLNSISSLIVSTKKSIKSSYRENDDELEYYLRFINVDALEENINDYFAVDYELNLNDKSFDEELIFASSHSIFFVIKIKPQKAILHKFEHGSSINDFLKIESKHGQLINVVTVCDNRLNIWPIELSKNQNNSPTVTVKKVNYDSHNVLFFYDCFEHKSPVVFIYNLFDFKNETEYLAVYDLCEERLIRQFKLVNSKERNDIQPLANFGEYFILYRRSTQSYCIIDFNYKVQDEILSGKKKLFKRLNKNKFLINTRWNETDEIDQIEIFIISKENPNFNDHKTVVAWHNTRLREIEWYLVSFVSIIYKISSINNVQKGIVKICSFDDGNDKNLNIPDIDKACEKKVSDDGKYLIVLNDLNNIKVYNIETPRDRDNLDPIYQVNENCTNNFYIFDTFLIYEISDSDKFKLITYIKDVKKRHSDKILWMKSTIGNYDITTNYYRYHDGETFPNYLWCEKKFLNINTKRIMKNEIYMIDFNSIEKTIKTCLDIGKKMKDSQYALINYGQGFLTKKLNSLDFVILSVSSLDKKPDLEFENVFKGYELDRLQIIVS